MSMMQEPSSREMSEDTQRAVRLIEKLLRLSSQNSNVEEAAAAAAKAQELLTLHNIDLSTVEQGGGESGKREDQKLRGGVYEWQRDLWRYIAELNFCMYWSERRETAVQVRTRSLDGTMLTKTKLVTARHHRVVGRAINVTVTRQMAEYIEQAIERKVQERLSNGDEPFYTRDANSFRQGAAAQVIKRIYARTREMLRKEQAEKIEREQRAHAAQMAGVSLETALTISDVRKSERDANTDFLYGEGTSARWAAQRAARAEAARQAEAQYTAWAAAHPEDAAKKAAEERAEEKAASKRRGRRPSFNEKVKNVDPRAFKLGYESAKDIGLDPQVRQRDNVERIGHE